MIVSIHQPNFIPWLGYFYKIAQSDVFVLLDDVQYSKNSFINRNRIKTAQGGLWLTLPVKIGGHFGQNINECIIQQKEQTIRKLLNSIRLNYSKAAFFHQYFDEFASVLQAEGDNLSNINIALIKWVCKCLDIHTQLVTSSSMNIPSTQSTERLIEICKHIGGTTYLCGKGGSKYQDERMFKSEQIGLITSSFIHPTYMQLWGEFVPDLSVIDLMFNLGAESINLILDKEHILTNA